ATSWPEAYAVVLFGRVKLADGFQICKLLLPDDGMEGRRNARTGGAGRRKRDEVALVDLRIAAGIRGRIGGAGSSRARRDAQSPGADVGAAVDGNRDGGIGGRDGAFEN